MFPQWQLTYTIGWFYRTRSMMTIMNISTVCIIRRSNHLLLCGIGSILRPTLLRTHCIWNPISNQVNGREQRTWSNTWNSEYGTYSTTYPHMLEKAGDNVLCATWYICAAKRWQVSRNSWNHPSIHINMRQSPLHHPSQGWCGGLKVSSDAGL